MCTCYRSTTNIDVDETAVDEMDDPTPSVADSSASTSQQQQSVSSVMPVAKQRCDRKRKVDPVEQELLAILRTPNGEPDDPDKAFFMSLYGDFRKLPDSMKMRTKLKLVQVMCDAAEAVQPVVVPIESTMGSVFVVHEQ